VIAMPRSARTQSETNIYHVMLRGISQVQLFYEDADRVAFMDRLQRFKDECGFTLYAYCLMGNHVHLLIKEDEQDLSLIMKKISLSYSCWFNAKYDRNGYLFQGRYKREGVASNEYLLEVVRYIHNNPVKVGESVSSWTSYDDYTKAPRIADTDFILGLFDDDLAQARQQFAEFINAQPDTEEAALLRWEAVKTKDADAIALIKDVAQVSACTDVATAEKDERNRVLALLKKRGLSIRQLARLTGLSRGIVQRAS
jgi:REP element-mobilizing transposase RayT